MKAILVTGGAGFIGSNFIPLFVSDGLCQPEALEGYLINNFCIK